MRDEGLTRGAGSKAGSKAVGAGGKAGSEAGRADCKTGKAEGKAEEGRGGQRRSGWRRAEGKAEEGRGGQRRSGWRKRKVAEVAEAAEEGMVESAEAKTRRAESEAGRPEAKEKKEGVGER
jgi:hypothetical protein